MKIKKTNPLKRRLKTLCFKMFNRLENNGNCNIKTNGESLFIEHLTCYFRNQPIVFFDVGANIGKYSKQLKDKAADNSINIDFHLFEPVRSTYNELDKEFGNESNFILNNVSLSSEKGHAEIYYDKEKSGLASMYQRNLDYYQSKLDKSETIVTERADQYIKDKGISKIDFMKIDVEGHELEVLKGFGDYLNPSFISFIQFEYGGCNMDSRTTLLDLFNILSEKGFVLHKIMPSHLEPRTWEPFIENYIYQNYVAVSSVVLKDL